jgi:hypothetical protein
MAGCMRGSGGLGLVSTLWRYEAVLDSATIGRAWRNAVLQRVYDKPRERVNVAGLLGSLGLRLEAG